MTTTEALETARQRLVALSARLKRYNREAERKKINKLFCTDAARVYSKLRGKKWDSQNAEPPKAETERFWKDIWEKEATHNTTAEWLKELQRDHQQQPEQEPITITGTDLGQRLQRMKSWTAPGPDMIHAYWLKKLTSLHNRLACQMQQLLLEENHPAWLTKGRTILLMKDPQQGAIPKNYRPITCLCTMWKLMSGILADKLLTHMGEHLHEAQKGIGNDSRGSKHQLLVDQTVMKDSRSRHTNLAMAWIDYRKAYDSVPHTWILETLRLYKVDSRVVRFLKRSMSLWKTTLHCNSKVIAEVNINCGIYQGDALSPLLFCIALNPLSALIDKSGMGYKFRSGARINHLFYMDDIKLYAKTERDIDSLIHLTRVFSGDIGMSFGLEKCGRLIVNRGKAVNTNGVQLPAGRIKDIENGYKYLGILQSYGNHDDEIRITARQEYRKRLRRILDTQLTCKNKMTAINTFAIPVIRYTAGVIQWRKEDLTSIDTGTRKLLTLHGAFHPKSNVARLYTSRKKGGRGLHSVETTVQQEETSLNAYVMSKATSDPLMAECARHLNSQRGLEERSESWHEKPLHGAYHRAIAEVADLERSYQWLVKVNLKDSTEALITAAQEQALSTRAVEARIYHTRQDPRCRMCKGPDETITHLISGCAKLAGTSYTERHNQVALIVYRAMCRRFELPIPSNWWEYPEKVVENDQAKIIWDFQIQTDTMVGANQPDIVLINKPERKALIIDIAVPADTNLRDKELEKITKYQPLCEELRRIWNVNTKVVPVVVGALGAVTPSLQTWLAEIPGDISDLALQKSALLATSKILRRTLKLPGLW